MMTAAGKAKGGQLGDIMKANIGMIAALKDKIAEGDLQMQLPDGEESVPLLVNVCDDPLLSGCLT